MNKIKQIKDIEHEKMRLRVKQLELEKQMGKNWDSVKSSLSFKNISAGKNESASVNTHGAGTLLTTIIDFGAGYLSRFLSAKAGQKLELTLQKGAYKLAHKIKTGLQKKS